jgi:Nuclease-related domain.
MKNFINIAVIVVVIAVVIILIYLIKNIRGEINAKKILKYGRQSEDFIYNLLRTRYSGNNIIRNAYYRINNGGTTEVDIILVASNGIQVIEVKGMKGYIENPFKGDWCQMYRNKVLMFQNPFEQNVPHITAIQKIIRKEQISNVPIRNIVVFTDPTVKFEFKEEMLLTSNKLLPFLADLNRNKFLKRKEIRNITRVLKKYQLKGNRVKRNHIDYLK